MDNAEREFWESIRDHARFVRRRKNVALSAARVALALEEEIEERLRGELTAVAEAQPTERQS